MQYREAQATAVEPKLSPHRAVPAKHVDVLAAARRRERARKQRRPRQLRREIHRLAWLARRLIAMVQKIIL